MSGETQDNISAWTIDSLKMHLDVQIADLKAALSERYEAQTVAMQTALVEQEKARDAALEAAEKARDAALHSLEKRLDGMNAFREQLREQNITFARVDVVDAQNAELRKAIERNADRAGGIELRIQSMPSRDELATSAITLASSVEQVHKVMDEKAVGLGNRVSQLDLRAQNIPSQAEKDALAQAIVFREEALGKRIIEIELRNQTLISRSEIDTLNNSSIARTTGLTERITNLELRMQSRLDLSQGHGAGINAAWVYVLGAIAALGTIATFYLAVKGP